MSLLLLLNPAMTGQRALPAPVEPAADATTQAGWLMGAFMFGFEMGVQYGDREIGLFCGVAATCAAWRQLQRRR